MGLGLSFGSSGTKTNTSGTMTKDETTNQQQSTNTSGTTKENQTTNQSSSSTGSSTTNQTTGQVSQGTKDTKTQQSTNLFSGDILSNLEGVAGQLLGNLFNGKTNPAVASMGAFDPTQFVEQTTKAAAAKQSGFLDAALGGLGDAIGSAFSNNSMAALLGNRATSDAAAAIAGVQADATKTAQGIVNQNAQTQIAGQAQDTNLITQILGALKGGTQTTTGAQAESTNAGTTTNASGTTQTSEQGQQSTNTSSMQVIQQLVDALLSGKTSTVGTENSTTTGKTKSGGLSLSL